MIFFYLGVFLLSSTTLMYELVLTRLLSVICWYYLAFVSVSMAMFGMTAGSLWVHFRPQLFSAAEIPRRLCQAALAMAASLPLALVTLLAVPIEISYSAETFFSFLLFTSIISVPFFFSGVGICLALTRCPFPIARVYSADLIGAALGCLGAIGLMRLLDAPSAILAISALVFLAAAAFRYHQSPAGTATKPLLWALALFSLALANSCTLYGIQPIWSKGAIDPRQGLLDEVWNPISKVTVVAPPPGPPYMWGASPRLPALRTEYLLMDIDNSATTPIFRFDGNLSAVSFLNFDVTSLADQLRPHGSAAIIGMGGGRDVLAAATQQFRRIVAIEVNPSIVDLVTRQYAPYSGLDSLPQLEVHNDEGRTYLTRSREKFDVIQASLVDTWAATSAGAFALTENGLYTVDAWRIFYHHLAPGGLITFTRWNYGPDAAQTRRMFSLAMATLLAEGADRPADHLALIGSRRVATLLVCNQPFSSADLDALNKLVSFFQFDPIYIPGHSVRDPVLATIASARSAADLLTLRDPEGLDVSPAFDSAPFFFNSVPLRLLPRLIASLGIVGNLRALAFLLCFLAAAVVLLFFVILLPLLRLGSAGPPDAPRTGLAGGIVYFVAIGLGFLLVEMAFVQQLSIFLGQPIYSLAAVLGGLILASGAGSLLSGKLSASSPAVSRIPAVAACLVIAAMSARLVHFIHAYAALGLPQRVALCLLLVAPCGLLMGGCFPLGLERMRLLGHQRNLPWMWALNGAASVLASFLAVIISMESSLAASALLGAACYAVAALALPWTPVPNATG